MPGDIHLIRLEYGKANAIDGRFLSSLDQELDRALESGKKAVVVTGRERFFSAGLDLRALPEGREEMASFIDEFEKLNRKLLEFPLPLVTAVNGHAIAGGSGVYQVGVSEVSLGIVFPASAFEIMRATLAPPFVPDVLLGGKLLDPRQAVEAGILHRLVPPDELLVEAEAAARELGEKPPVAFRHSKLALRAPILERIEKTRAESRRLFLDTWCSPEVAERRKAMLAR
jgi:enoyl-CoA hydratase